MSIMFIGATYQTISTSTVPNGKHLFMLAERGEIVADIGDGYFLTKSGTRPEIYMVRHLDDMKSWLIFANAGDLVDWRIKNEGKYDE